jgi:MprA protease rhombosortase-interaction domain-containing protein
MRREHEHGSFRAMSIPCTTLLAALLVSSSALHAQAAISYAYAGPASGNQNYAGALGLDFDVIDAIRVTHLLAFDDDADGWTMGTEVSVAIYDRDTGIAVTPYVTFSPEESGDLMGGSYRGQLLFAPLTLEAGGHYSVVAQAFNANDRPFNAGAAATGTPLTDDGGGLIAFTGTGRYGLPQNVLPTTLDVGPFNRYGAGSFAFEAVPEPSTALLAAAGALAFARRRRA